MQILLLDAFCDALWLEDGLSRNTLESYRRDLAQFQSWLQAKRSRGLTEATHDDVIGYLAHRVKATRPATASRLLSSVKR